MTVAEFASRWTTLFPRSPQTDAHNAAMARAFVDRFGARKLSGLDPLAAIEWAQSDPRHARYARTLLNDAKRAGLLDTNPLQGVRLRAPERAERYQPTVREVDELVAIADRVAGESFGTMILLAAYSGLRQGQLTPLLVADVASAAEPLRALARPQKMNPERMVTVLRPCRQRLAYALSGRSGLVFPAARGGPLAYAAHARLWGRVREEFGRPVRFHDLRGFCASWMLNREASPFDVALQLHGKADPATVLRYYTMAERVRDAAGERLEAL